MMCACLCSYIAIRMHGLTCVHAHVIRVGSLATEGNASVQPFPSEVQAQLGGPAQAVAPGTDVGRRVPILLLLVQ